MISFPIKTIISFLSLTHTQDVLMPRVAKLPDIKNMIYASEKAEQDRQKAK